MTSLTSMSQTAENLFAESFFSENDAKFDFERLQVEVCPVRWLLPDLLKLIAENVDQPVAELKSTIRQIVQQQSFATGGGDCVVRIDHQRMVDDYVQRLIVVLEEVRTTAQNGGTWPCGLSAPVMYG